VRCEVGYFWLEGRVEPKPDFVLHRLTIERVWDLPPIRTAVRGERSRIATTGKASTDQEASPPPQDPSPGKAAADPKPDTDGNGSAIDSPQPKATAVGSAQQTKRILWIIPNYRSVSADTHLPPDSFKEKFWLATQDSFDYSAFIYEGMLSGAAMAQKSEPPFGQGASCYGLCFAHTFADGTIENYMVEAVVPTLLKEDPRYYTLGHGGFFKRSAYAITRVFITRRDSGSPTFNLSEVIGAGAAAGIGNSYYPAESNPFVKTYQRWISQIVQDSASNIVKEFWPDINRAFFHNKY
jgi:hypothetical protein